MAKRQRTEMHGKNRTHGDRFASLGPQSKHVATTGLRQAHLLGGVAWGGEFIL